LDDKNKVLQIQPSIFDEAVQLDDKINKFLAENDPSYAALLKIAEEVLI
jgi:hypothetical protein